MVIKQRKNYSYKFLKRKYERYISILTNYLNKYHNVNYNQKYWEIICGMWLSTYI